MSGFLSRMARASAQRAADARARESASALLARALATAAPARLVLAERGFDVIAEVKRRSPAAGALLGSADTDASAQARAYLAGGAAAISVLTEPEQFQGSLDDLRDVARAVALPVLRKDFLVDPYQVLEARAAGAAGVLLVLKILDDAALDTMLEAIARMQLFVLIEAFDEEDLERCAGAADRARGKGITTLVGLNARNLDTLTIDGARLERLRARLPEGFPTVAESGLEAPQDAARVAALGYRMALVGSALMRSPAPSAALRTLLEAGRSTLPGARLEATPDSTGRFGPFGGRFVPEMLMGALTRLTTHARAALADAGFRDALEHELRTWVGRPTPLTEATRLGKEWHGSIWLKREDLAHTGAHKINNAIGQALLAARMGAKRVIAETGAGQHGVATAAACARLSLPCTVYMGVVDAERQAPNVDRMQALGAEVVRVTSGDRTLRAAIDEALRAWVSDPEATYYLLGSAVGPHPYPWLVRELQSVIGREARRQCLDRLGRLPDLAVACVGGGSNSIGLFHPFLPDLTVDLLGIEAGGRGSGIGENAATLAHGRPGVLHGSYSFLLQDGDGQVVETHSISAGLDYPGVGPEHSFLRASGRVRYETVSDEEAMDAVRTLSALEGILPAIESAHALAGARRFCGAHPGRSVLVGLSGRGDKDLLTIAQWRASRG